MRNVIRWMMAVCCVAALGLGSVAPGHAQKHRSSSRVYYGGGKHTTSHGGHYSGATKGSSHKGGHYRNVRTGNHYGKHK